MRLGVNGRFYGVPVWGVQRFARELTARLLLRGDTTLLLPRGARPPADAPRGDVVRGRLGGHAWEQLELPWQAHRLRCDAVLHVSGTAPVWGGPHVVALHDVLPLTNPEWFSRPFVLWFRSAVRRAASRAAAILAPSAWSRAEVVRVLGVPEEKVHVVAQGVAPFDAPAPADEVRRVRRARGLPERYVLAVGGDDPRKNLAFLLDVLDRWRMRDRDAPVLVIAGAHRARVHGRRGGPERRAGVIRLGYVADEDLHALYTGAGAFCFPSLAEGFGRPPLEAMACGTPAVVAPYGPAREVLGEAALVLPLEPDAWTDAMAELLEVGDARRRRIAAGFRQASTHRWEAGAHTARAVCEAVASRAEANGRRQP